jgi:hypothetical protein
LHRAIVLIGRVGVPKAARQQEVGELGDEVFEIQIVEQIAGELGVPVLHNLKPEA